MYVVRDYTKWILFSPPSCCFDSYSSASLCRTESILEKHWWFHITPSKWGTSSAVGLLIGSHAFCESHVPSTTSGCCTCASVLHLGTCGRSTFCLLITQETIDFRCPAPVEAHATAISKGTPSTDSTGRTGAGGLCQNAGVAGGGGSWGTAGDRIALQKSLGKNFGHQEV